MQEQTSSEQQINVVINADMTAFGGSFANGFEMYSNGNESRIDFIYADLAHMNPETMEAPAKIAARVIMTTDKMIELRDQLDRHIQSNTGGNNE